MRIDMSVLPTSASAAHTSTTASVSTSTNSTTTSSQAEDAVNDAMAMLFDSSGFQMEDTKSTRDETQLKEDIHNSIDMDKLALRLQAALQEANNANTNANNANSSSSSTTTTMSALDDCFKSCDLKATQADRLAEFRFTEDFIVEEQNARRVRQVESRKTEASEEKRLAVEVAQLKGLRLKSSRTNSDEDLRWKTTHAERSYTSRKMVYAKAAQVAGAELRLQFARVRSFLEELHLARQQVLHRRHRRTLNFQTLVHTLKKTDPRVVSLDEQIAMRLFRKKKADLNEFHMARTLEEAIFLESMMGVVDKVQTTKEEAARDMLDLHVRNLKEVRNTYDRHKDELELFAASGTLEMAKLVAQYTEEDLDDKEVENQTEENVGSIERSKIFDAKERHVSTTKLYDTILWSVASNDLGLSSLGSSLYSSDFGSEILVDEDEEDEINSSISNNIVSDLMDMDPNNEANNMDAMDLDDDASEHSHEESKCRTPVGTMHARQLTKELRTREKALLKKHAKEIHAERLKYQKAGNALKAKHQVILDGIIETGLSERDALQDTIDERMDALARQQEENTEQMRKNDLELMKNALLAEDQRVEEAESNSFRRAQELISAQVFHEVRNALSAVIAMSEMTNTLKTDSTLPPKELVGKVDDMLDQIGDVVNYALNMLNEILDVSKINSGAFAAKKEAFDLQDVVARSTRMQQAKASKIKMAFQPLSKPCIAVSDSGIVERIVATMISNAVKFTPTGAVQPFICELDTVPPGTTAAGIGKRRFNGTIDVSRRDSASTASTASESTSNSNDLGDSERLPIKNTRMKMYAVGVADTGCGLSEEKLQAAKLMITTSTSTTSTNGAQNTGFGLYHAHLQAKALNSHLAIATLDECSNWLNKDMLGALQKRKAGAGAKNDGSPGPGTVLYITIPVYEDCDGAYTALKKNTERLEMAQRMGNRCEYSFRPLPSPWSKDGCFRVLVADDVLMLRKGLVHTIGKLFAQKFPDCPVSVSTACTAEDMMRAVDAEAFDLIICDHHFNHDEKKVQKIVPGDPMADQRPALRFDESNSSQEATREGIRKFFKMEKFTTEKDDGKVLGLDALVELATSTSLRHPTPVLMLVSGHKIEAEPQLGIVVAQKPLKSQEFITNLEKQAANLVLSKRCQEHTDAKSNSTILVSQQGSQMFVQTKDGPAVPPLD